MPLYDATVGPRRWLGGFVPGARERRAQVAAHALAWEELNDLARAGDGPLWVVLGDSTAQAIGASSPSSGYVGQLQRRLEAAEGRSWRVLNLSRSGARVADVVEVQLPQLDAISDPALVTCAIGANDMLPGRGAHLEVDLRALLDGLPPGAVVATLPQGMRESRARALNQVLRAEAGARGLRIADVWEHSGPPWRDRFAADHFHPNDLGYQGWADAFADALEVGAPGRGSEPPL